MDLKNPALLLTALVVSAILLPRSLAAPQGRLLPFLVYNNGVEPEAPAEPVAEDNINRLLALENINLQELLGINNLFPNILNVFGLNDIINQLLGGDLLNNLIGGADRANVINAVEGGGEGNPVKYISTPAGLINLSALLAGLETEEETDTEDTDDSGSGRTEPVNTPSQTATYAKLLQLQQLIQNARIRQSLGQLSVQPSLYSGAYSKLPQYYSSIADPIISYGQQIPPPSSSAFSSPIYQPYGQQIPPPSNSGYKFSIYQPYGQQIPPPSSSGFSSPIIQPYGQQIPPPLGSSFGSPIYQPYFIPYLVTSSTKQSVAPSEEIINEEDVQAIEDVVETAGVDEAKFTAEITDQDEFGDQDLVESDDASSRMNSRFGEEEASASQPL